MPVNFNILQPIQPPKMLGSLPQGPSTSQQVGDLGQGIMQGVLQGQQMQSNAQAIEMNKIKLGEAKQGQVDAATLRAAAQKSQDDYFAAMMKIDPVSANAGLKARQDFQNSVLQGESTVEDIKGKKLDYAMKVNNGLGQLAGVVAQQQDPAAAKQMWETQAPVYYSHLGMKIPEDMKQYDQSKIIALASQSTINATAMASTTRGQLMNVPDKERPEAIKAINNAEADKNAPASIKEAREITRLEQLQNSGKATVEDIATLSNLRNMSSAGNVKFNNTKSLRDEVTKANQPFVVINDAHNKIQAAANDPSGAGDMALIFGYMKILDPSSTVREGEYATAQNAASIPERIKALYKRVVDGQKLTPSQRADFLKQADALYKSQEKTYEKTLSNYTDLATRNGLDPKDVILDVRTDKQKGTISAGITPEQARAELKRRGIQ